jgi:hypothetical protein
VEGDGQSPGGFDKLRERAMQRRERLGKSALESGIFPIDLKKGEIPPVPLPIFVVRIGKIGDQQDFIGIDAPHGRVEGLARFRWNLESGVEARERQLIREGKRADPEGDS